MQAREPVQLGNHRLPGIIRQRQFNFVGQIKLATSPLAPPKTHTFSRTESNQYAICKRRSCGNTDKMLVLLKYTPAKLKDTLAG
jgi:hypothetical protein